MAIKIIKGRKTYENGSIGLREFSLDLPMTGIVFLKGQSGSGKTTFINCLSGLDYFTSGKILINETETNSLENESSFLFQENYFIEYLSAFDNLKCVSDADDQLIDSLLARMKLTHLKNNKASELSGGERFRFSFIRSIIQNKPIVFLDEPFANLDEENIEIMSNVIKEYSNQKLFIISSHQVVSLESQANVIINIDNDHNLACRNGNKALDSKNYATSIVKKKAKPSITIKHFLSFFKRNVFKNILSIILFFFSFASICVALSLSVIDKSLVRYETYKTNNQSEVMFRRFDEDDSLGSSVFNDDIKNMKPDAVSYSFRSFFMKDDEDSFAFQEVRVLDNSKIKDDETVIYASEDLHSAILNYCDYSIKVIDVKRSETNVLLINNNTYARIKANLYENCKIGIDRGDGFTSCDVYNSYYKNVDMLDLRMAAGSKPQEDNQITIPKTLLSCFNLSENNAIGKSIAITFRNISQYSKIEKVKETYNFTISGLSEKCLFFHESKTEYFLGRFGYDSLDNSDKSIVFDNFSKHTFANAEKSNLIPVGEVSQKIDSAIGTCENLKPFVLAIMAVFITVASVSIINNIHTSISKAKKEIGILICFDVKKKEIIAPFALETIADALSALIFSIPTALLALFFVNRAFSKNLEIRLSIANLHPASILLLVAYIAVLSAITIIVSFLLISKKKRIDVLKDNN